MLMPDRVRDDREASLESGVSLASIVTVAEPMDCPAWEAVTLTVSSPSTTVSSVAATVAMTGEALATSVSDFADSV